MGFADYKEYLKVKPGDLNGFFQLFFDNLATLLGVIFTLKLTLTGFFSSDLFAAQDAFPAEMGVVGETIDKVIFQRSLPGLAVTMIFGNIYYALQAVRLMKNDPEGKEYTCLPYGINTPGAFAFLFSIIGPTVAGSHVVDCVVGGLANPTNAAEAAAYAQCWVSSVEKGWEAGVVANFVAGLISIVLGFAGRFVLKVTPVVSLLSAIGAIGFVFLGLAQIGFSFSQPIAGLLPVFLVIAAYFGEISFWKIPKSLVVVLVGVILAWADGVSTIDDLKDSGDNVQFWGLSTGFSALGDWTSVGENMGTILPVALVAAAGTLMNVMSAELAGDKYPVVETMVSDGVGTAVGAMFGTPFGTSVYIGHPAYKKMGAGVAYSFFNCFFFFIFALFGIFAPISALIPQTAVSPLILFVGLTIVDQAIQASAPRHYPAIVLALFPSLCDWAVIGGITLAGIGGTQLHGFESLSKGSMMIALVISAITVFIIDRKFLHTVGWSLFAALLAGVGIIHQPAAQVKDDKDALILGKWTDPTVLYCSAPRNGAGTCDAGYSECLNLNFAPACAWEQTTKWRFMTAYLLVAATFGIFYVAQRFGFIDPPREDDEEEEEQRAIKAVDSEL